MGCITHIRHILKRDGTHQFERLAIELEPGFVKVDERSREDLQEFFSKFAGQVQFYDLQGQPDGDWNVFFEDFSRQDEPHLALALAFIDLFTHAQDKLNEFTLRHLEHYYRKVLQVKGKPAQPDRVHLLIEPAKQVMQYLLPAGTRFLAGKDALGKMRYYDSEAELVVNKASVGKISSVYTDKKLYHRIYCAPVANSSDGLGKAFETAEPMWPAFGESQSGKKTGSGSMTEAPIGFAVSGNLLLVREGQRNIRLQFAFHAGSGPGGKTLEGLPADSLEGSLEAWFTGEEGWIGPYEVSVSIAGDKVLDMQVSLGPGDPPVAGYMPGIHTGSFVSGIPVMKILMKSKAEPYPYEYLRLLRMKKMNLALEVKGIRSVTLFNDQGEFDQTKPFQPFGHAPAVGSAFYIGSREVFGKKLSTLKLRWKWRELPGGFGGFESYYNDYNGTYKTDGFLAEVSLLKDNQWLPASGRQSVALFNLRQINVRPSPGILGEKNLKKSIGKSKEIFMGGSKNIIMVEGGDMSIGFNEEATLGLGQADFFMGSSVLSFLDAGEISRDIDATAFPAPGPGSPPEPSPSGPATGSAFLRMILKGQHFGHKEYASAQMRKAFAISSYFQAYPEGTNPPDIPGVPYTPVMEYLELDYTASAEATFPKSSSDPGIEGYYHVEAFGESRLGTGADLMMPDYDRAGYLYLGINELRPPQTLSLLFQVAESSNDPDVSPDEEGVAWAYLAESGWKVLDSAHIISDSTAGLKGTGIILFSVPSDASASCPLMPEGFHWLRASVKTSPEGMNRLIDVKAQALTAVFHDQGNDPVHLAQPLAAGSVTKLEIPSGEIKKVIQPFASFGGRIAEDGNGFSRPYFTRISERLRHKNRAVTVWDMERMVLEAFPGIYKVKCLNHAHEESDIAPGHITAVIIDNLRNRNAVNPLQPRASLATLTEIALFLEKYVSPHTRVHVQNPLYEEILVDFDVAFHPGFDAGYYQTQLNGEIRKFLSPWAYSEGEDILFGHTIYKSSIINFIEERPYVDFLTNFKMFHIYQNWGIGCMIVRDDFVVGSQEKLLDRDEAEARTSRSILVSAAEHVIRVLDKATCELE